MSHQKPIESLLRKLIHNEKQLMFDCCKVHRHRDIDITNIALLGIHASIICIGVYAVHKSIHCQPDVRFIESSLTKMSQAVDKAIARLEQVVNHAPSECDKTTVSWSSEKIDDLKISDCIQYAEQMEKKCEATPSEKRAWGNAKRAWKACESGDLDDAFYHSEHAIEKTSTDMKPSEMRECLKAAVYANTAAMYARRKKETC